MNLKRCEHGHFYDQEKFADCPYCAGGNQQQGITRPLNGAVESGEKVTEPVTVPMYENKTNPVPQSEDTVYNTADTSNLSLQAALGKAKQVTSNVDSTERDEQKTISIYQAKQGIEPVAGWLVCIEGESFGASYTLKTGRNFIGRGADMDVVLSEDHSVSRQKHAIILYEPRKREFLAQPGDSRELFYLNDEVVLGAERLHANDILTIGNTKLMFFPCCGENFSWDDFKKDNN